MNLTFYLIEYYAIVNYLLVSLLLSLIIFSLSYFVVLQNNTIEKVSAYECGFQPFIETRIKFDIKFYVVALSFLIFDLEIIFLIPWSVSLDFLGFFGLIIMCLFLVILIIGFIYELMKGALTFKKVKN